MDANSFRELGVGLPIAVAAAALILLMVFRELGPASGLGPQGKVILSVGLGLGVLAFAVKLVAILVVERIPPSSIASRTPVERMVVRDRESDTRDLRSFSNSRDGSPVPYAWQALPDSAPAPGDNPVTPAKVALGERLFHDKSLSVTGEISCSTCHDVKNGAGVDGLSVSAGVGGKRGQRNAPTVWNVAFQTRFFWDGRASSLEEQAKGPLVNAAEMGMPSLDAVEERVRANPTYRDLFARAFDDKSAAISIERIAAAIAAYERTLVSSDTPYDRFVRGDRNAMTEAQLRGMALFQSVGCILCHSGPNFSASSVFDGSAPLRAFPANPTQYDKQYRLTMDKGLAVDTAGPGVWRVPSLRNVALTGPYFHNGSVADLEEAVRVMASAQLGVLIRDSKTSGVGGVWFPNERVLAAATRPKLSDADVNDIAEFLRALTGESLEKRRGSQQIAQAATKQAIPNQAH